MAAVEKCIFEYFRQYAADCGQELYLFDENRRYTVDGNMQKNIIKSIGL